MENFKPPLPPWKMDYICFSFTSCVDSLFPLVYLEQKYVSQTRIEPSNINYEGEKHYYFKLEIKTLWLFEQVFFVFTHWYLCTDTIIFYSFECFIRYIWWTMKNKDDLEHLKVKNYLCKRTNRMPKIVSLIYAAHWSTHYLGQVLSFPTNLFD